MHRNSIAWLTILVILTLFCSADTASAMSAFSRKYKMQCDGCHKSRIPELNEFGIEFYKKGFVLSDREGKVGIGNPQGDADSANTAASSNKVSTQAEGKTTAKTNAAKDDQDAGEGDQEESKPPTEVPPTVVYKGESSDGTIIFTDSPERLTGTSRERVDETKESSTERIEKTHRPKKKNTATPRQQVRQTGGQAVESVAIEEQKKFRNYEECMEHQLVGAKQPGSAQEMTDLMMTAERKCSGYSLKKR